MHEPSYKTASVVLFASLFAAQAGVIAVSPILVRLADDLDVSTGVAGQLRTITGLSAGLTALLAGRIGLVLDLRQQLLTASILLAAGSLASAAAPSYLVLAAAQIPIGLAVALYVTAGTIASASWVAPELRTRVLSWALVGQPAAWIVGMPLSGIVGEWSWRYAWLTVPFAAALGAGLVLVLGFRAAGSEPDAPQPVALRSALVDPDVARWLAAELLANTAWAGTLVYAGALFVESYDSTTATAGVVLAIGAGAYIVGNRVARGLSPAHPRAALTALSLVLAAATFSFGAARWSLATSSVLFSVAALFAGSRTMISSSYGLARRPALRPALMGARAATMQFGYFGGSIAGGLASATAGYTALGVVIGGLFLAAAATLAPSPRPHRLPTSHAALLSAECQASGSGA